MELLLNGEASARVPDANFFLEWFGEEHDPGDFLVLRDAALGELRATAPQAGICLLQTDGAAPTDGVASEVELSQAEAARLFAQFLARDLGFRAPFERAAETASFSWIGWLLGVFVAAALWWGWRLF